jgi:hypothetical protein
MRALPPPHRVQGAGAAAAAELHAEPEQEAADRHLQTGGSQCADDAVAEHLAAGEDRRKQQHGEPKHDQLRHHARDLAIEKMRCDRPR